MASKVRKRVSAEVRRRLMERRELREAAREKPPKLNQVAQALDMPHGPKERLPHPACARTLERILFGDDFHARAVATK